VTMIAGADEQGRFFGLLDGGRGLIDAMLATVAITLFAWATQTKGESVAAGFRMVVYMYAFLCIALGVVLVLVKDPHGEQGARAAAANRAARRRNNVLAD
ncbi:MFS transporter, partial [Paraburkholderia sp. SIMBA_061]